MYFLKISYKFGGKHNTSFFVCGGAGRRLGVGIQIKELVGKGVSLVHNHWKQFIVYHSRNSLCIDQHICISNAHTFLFLYQASFTLHFSLRSPGEHFMLEKTDVLNGGVIFL